MGKLITTWSPYHGQCKTTATTVAMAQTAGNALVTHIQFTMNNMEAMCGITDLDPNVHFSDIGFNNLIYTTMGKQITKTDVENAVVQITDRMALLPALGHNTIDSTRVLITEHILTEILPKYYQYVFVDLGTATHELAKAIQNKADINYIILPQNKALWEKYDQTDNDRYILAGYDRNSKFTKQFFQWNISRHVDIVPYCVEYADAISSCDVKNFFLRNENVLQNPSASEDILYFFRELKEVRL